VDFYQGLPDGRAGYGLTGLQREALHAGGVPCGNSLVFPKQVHGDVIWCVDILDAGRRGEVEADAVVTDTPGLPIAVRTADCLPLLMVDPHRRVVAAVHAGWKSAKLEIAFKTVECMRTRYGVDPRHVRAVIGPCIRRENYQVSADFKAFFPGEVHEVSGHCYLDLAAVNARQLIEAGVLEAHLFDCGLCSFGLPKRFFSFRREAEGSGRMLSVIMMTSDDLAMSK
jgi:YfiH family protein